jgi:hypothetical protein
MSVLLYTSGILVCFVSPNIPVENLYLMGGGHESGLQLILQHEITARLGGGGGTEWGRGPTGSTAKEGQGKNGSGTATKHRRKTCIGR